MASRSRYVKIDCGPAPHDKITAKNSSVGCSVISDYIDSELHRVLVVERPLTTASHRATKPKLKARVNTKPDPNAPFPTGEVIRG